MSIYDSRKLVLLAGLGLGVLLTGCERPPVDTKQIGYRGVAMEQVTNPRTAAELEAANKLPASIPPLPDVPGPRASEIYQNVQVLGDLSGAQFTRLMASITAWVAPAKGCNYCHEVGNMASDALYTKVVARKMIQMTRDINTNWQDHVVQTGVTCYTCHRGQPVPANIWFKEPGGQYAMVGADTGQNKAGRQVGLASLPNDPFTPYLLSDETIRAQATDALPTDYRHSIQATEKSYALMVHMSKGLGVNCTFCHNTRSFASWKTSTPQRATAWYGIRMARAINNEHLTPLTEVFPPHRLGALGDVAKVNCATCHQGVNKPLYGQSMLKDFMPELGPGSGMAAAAPAQAEAEAAPAPATEEM